MKAESDIQLLSASPDGQTVVIVIKDVIDPFLWSPGSNELLASFKGTRIVL